MKKIILIIFGIFLISSMAYSQEQNVKKKGDISLKENSRQLTRQEKKKFDDAFKDFQKYQKREAALKKIKAMGQPAINELHKKIKTKKLGVVEREIGISVLKKLKHSESTEVLLEIAEDKTEKPNIRGRAASAIYYIGQKNDIKTFERLKNFITTESNETVRRSAVMATGKVGQKHAINYLKGVLKSSETEKVKYSAISGLSAIEGEEAIDVLIDGLKDNNDFTSIYARVVGSGRKSRKAVKPFFEKLKELSSKRGDFAGTLRMVIFEALGDIGDKSAIPELRKYLNSEDFLDVQYAGLALCQLGDIAGGKKALNLAEKRNEIYSAKRIKKACGDLLKDEAK